MAKRDEEYAELVQSRTVSSVKQLLDTGARSIAFYAGSFDPPHYGHLAVIESALIGPADHVVVSVHSHNPSKADQLTPISFRRIMVALIIDASPLKEKIHIASEELLDGIQNESFRTLARTLEMHGIKAWVTMGADALKKIYNVEMRALPYIICSRSGYTSNAAEILAGQYIELETLEQPLVIIQEGKSDRFMALIYDQRIQAFHYVVRQHRPEWPQGETRVFVMFSGRIEGHDFANFTCSSYAAFQGGSWKAQKRDITFSLSSGSGEAFWTIQPPFVN